MILYHKQMSAAKWPRKVLVTILETHVNQVFPSQNVGQLMISSLIRISISLRLFFCVPMGFEITPRSRTLAQNVIDIEVGLDSSCDIWKP